MDMKVVVYGIGKRFINLFTYNESFDMGIIKNHIEIVGFSDSNPEMWGKEIVYNGRSFVTQNIRDFSQSAFDKIMVTTINFYDEIKYKFIQDGYVAEQIFPADHILESCLDMICYGKYPLLERQWMEIYDTGKYADFSSETKGYKDVAIYETGLQLSNWIPILEQCGLRVRYIINRQNDTSSENIPVFKAGAEFPSVDLIIVAQTENYMEIEKEICENNLINVISIQEFFYKMLKNCKERNEHA